MHLRSRFPVVILAFAPMFRQALATAVLLPLLYRLVF